ncbi:MAG: Uma2 family endonuclease [Gemmatimonadales bacterium]
MPALQTPDYWTADMVRDLPDDGNRYETVHGELLVTPSPRMWHQIVASRLTRLLGDYLRREPVGMAFGLDADISWAPDVLVKPDVFVAPLPEVRTLDWAEVRSLLLVAEVLSPSTRRADRFVKRPLYQEVGIPLCWIIEADEHYAEVWTPDAALPTIEREALTWHPAGAVTACAIPLEELFRPV